MKERSRIKLGPWPGKPSQEFMNTQGCRSERVESQRRTERAAGMVIPKGAILIMKNISRGKKKHNEKVRLGFFFIEYKL